jgi:hypothetical protein
MISNFILKKKKKKIIDGKLSINTFQKSYIASVIINVRRLRRLQDI